MRRKGYMLVEVMTAVVILMLSAEVIVLSGAVTARVSAHTRKIMKAGEKVRSGSDGVPAKLKLEILEDAEPICRDGTIYRETVTGKKGTFLAWSVWMELSVPEGLEEENEQGE